MALLDDTLVTNDGPALPDTIADEVPALPRAGPPLAPTLTPTLQQEEETLQLMMMHPMQESDAVPASLSPSAPESELQDTLPANSAGSVSAGPGAAFGQHGLTQCKADMAAVQSCILTARVHEAASAAAAVPAPASASAIASASASSASAFASLSPLGRGKGQGTTGGPSPARGKSPVWAADRLRHAPWAASGLPEAKRQATCATAVKSAPQPRPPPAKRLRTGAVEIGLDGQMGLANFCQPASKAEPVPKCPAKSPAKASSTKAKAKAKTAKALTKAPKGPGQPKGTLLQRAKVISDEVVAARLQAAKFGTLSGPGQPKAKAANSGAASGPPPSM